MSRRRRLRSGRDENLASARAETDGEALLKVTISSMSAACTMLERNNGSRDMHSARMIVDLLIVRDDLIQFPRQ